MTKAHERKPDPTLLQRVAPKKKKRKREKQTTLQYGMSKEDHFHQPKLDINRLGDEGP